MAPGAALLPSAGPPLPGWHHSSISQSTDYIHILQCRLVSQRFLLRRQPHVSNKHRKTCRFPVHWNTKAMMAASTGPHAPVAIPIPIHPIQYTTCTYSSLPRRRTMITTTTRAISATTPTDTPAAMAAVLFDGSEECEDSKHKVGAH